MTTPPPPAPSAAEQAARKKLLFALHHRDKPTVAFIECKSTAKRDELAESLRADLAEYEFFTLDVTSLQVASLVRTLHEHLPEAVRQAPRVRYVVNVFGLENRLDEQVAAQLNLERELLFKENFLLLIWADAYFFRRLQKLAPDFWHWVTYKFRFDDPAARPVAQQAPLPAEVLPQKGNIEARQQRIQTLEDRYSHLDLDDSNKIRLLRDKVSTLSLLGGEYGEAFAYKKAIWAYRTAIALETQLQEAALTERADWVEPGDDAQIGKAQADNLLLAQLLFDLGWAYNGNRSFEQALDCYKQSMALVPQQSGFIYHYIGAVHAEQRQWDDALHNYRQALSWKEHAANNFEMGRTYHQIGVLYDEQQQWSEALANYHQALIWSEKEGDEVDLSNTYHRIGMVHAKNQQWPEALENYHKALELNRQTDNAFELAVTYHQLGMVCAWQQQWPEALGNYQQSLRCRERSGSTFQMGSTYHQIGVLYAKQGRWPEALENFREALTWNEKSGNTFLLGTTYSQIGRVYEAQNLLTEALNWFEKSLLNFTEHKNHNLVTAEDSLSRIREKMSAAGLKQ